MTLEEQLESVQRTISLIESGGQEVDLEVNENRRRLVRGDLRTLYRREWELKVAIFRKNGGGIHTGIPT